MTQRPQTTTPEQLLFTYPGSKARLASRLVRFFPEHDIYVSAFGGTGIEFAHKRPSRREVFNDIDDNIYAVFAVLRDRRLYEQLLRRLEHSHDSRRLYGECYDTLQDSTIGLLEQAYCFLIGCNRRRALPRIAQATHING
jgi:site-specific DNA-adenine methylase